MRLIALAMTLAAAAPIGTASGSEREAPRGSADAAMLPVRPLNIVETEDDLGATRLTLDARTYDELRTGAAHRTIELPISHGQTLRLDAERFDVTTSRTRFVAETPDGLTILPQPDVLCFRGRVVDDPRSHVFLALTARGSANGYVVTSGGERYTIAQSPTDAAARRRLAYVFKGDEGTDLPPFPEFCGVTSAHRIGPTPELSGDRQNSASTLTSAGLRYETLAIEADQAFVELFSGDVLAAQDYIVQLIAASSDIYIRDFDVKLVIDRVRLWPAGGEPFSASNISGFRSYYQANEDTTGLNIVQLLSGRRGLGYGGIAYVGGTCSGGATYSIAAYLLGSFPTPVNAPHLGNWDLIVSAHEMGHNMGTFHTHDGYSPTIDDCGNGVPSRGTIMSYCHTHPGGTTNIDLYFHRRVEEVVENNVLAGGCAPFDCNDNGLDDAVDLVQGSLDFNNNDIPDECEDCNNNGRLDTIDLALGAPDVNGNGLPDACETDCNANGLPDVYEISIGAADDLDGNNVPDPCDPDCNGNGVPDFIDIEAGHLDWDRNAVPDACQDCDQNGQSDWLDVERQGNLFVADRSGYVREYHRYSGYPIQNLGFGVVFDPHDAVFGPDRELYVASYGTDSVERLDVDSGAFSTFVSPGDLGLDGPTALTFGPNGNLFVASGLTSAILEYDGLTGSAIGTFVPSGAGGVNTPYGLQFGPDGRLYVTDTTNAVHVFDGGNGAPLGQFVTAGSGGLSGPRGLAFKSDGNLLVAGLNNNAILEYDGLTGTFVGIFNDIMAPAAPWGLRIGPNQNVFVGLTATPIYIVEYDELTGQYIRRYVRGDTALVAPTGFDFRPGSVNDSNANGLLDACDCEFALYGDVDGNGFITLADLFCVLDGFAGDFSVCSFADDDINPCGGNGVINLLDLFAVLDAFQGDFACCTWP